MSIGTNFVGLLMSLIVCFGPPYWFQFGPISYMRFENWVKNDILSSFLSPDIVGSLSTQAIITFILLWIVVKGLPILIGLKGRFGNG